MEVVNIELAWVQYEKERQIGSLFKCIEKCYKN